MARHRKNRNQPIAAPAQPKSFQKVNENAAGIDCGSDEHYVAVPADRDPQPVRRFGAFTADLIALAVWLQACRVETVAIESTGVYWIPLYEILEAHGIRVQVVDPRRMGQIPGRKTDVLDCQWIQQLHTFGLLAGAFRPVDQIVVLRSYMRQREMLVRYQAQHIQHMQKALEQMNLKLTEVLADITGMTGTRIIDAILGGQRDAKKLAALRDERCHNDEETIALALEGNWRQEHLFALKQAMELYRDYLAKISDVDQQIEAHLKTFEDKSGGVKLKPRAVKRTGHAPQFDVRQYLFQMVGVDLMTLDGFKSGHNVLNLISEIGTDMSAWPTEKHFASWLNLCPGIKKTGGRRLSGRRPKKAIRAANILRLAAYSLVRAKCALGAYLRRMSSRLGKPKAITATAHKLARIVYRMLKYGKSYVDVGVAYYEQRYRERMLAGLKRRASEMGFTLLPTTELKS
ncbi:MAG: IS110 family transposase [Acetobacteraceae bacterium]